MKSLIAVFALTLLSACAPRVKSSYVVTGPPGETEQAAESVQIRMEGQPDIPGYEEVAVVEATACGGTRAPFPYIIEALRRRAGALGANAVIHVHVDQGVSCAHGTGIAVHYSH